MTRILEIERRIAFAPDRVYAVWTDAETFASWFLPDPAVRITHATLDARVGGEFRIDMLVDGATLSHTGTYREVAADRRLVFTWRSAMLGETITLVEVDFEPEPDGTTRVRLRHRELPADDLHAAHAAGWTSILGALETHLNRR